MMIITDNIMDSNNDKNADDKNIDNNNYDDGDVFWWPCHTSSYDISNHVIGLVGLIYSGFSSRRVKPDQWKCCVMHKWCW